jgi:hypothetical protein
MTGSCEKLLLLESDIIFLMKKFFNYVQKLYNKIW